MKVSQLYKIKKKTLSFEIVPPEKNSELSSIDETLDILCELNPDFISVTFGAGGSENCNSTIEVAGKIKEKYNIEPVVHLTCLNYSKDEIDLIAKQLQQSGVQNILALRGDKIPNVQAKNDFKYASDLIAYMKSKYDFCFLGACYPEGSCSTQPGFGKYCVNSFCATLHISPLLLKRIQRLLVVPASRAIMYFAMVKSPLYNFLKHIQLIVILYLNYCFINVLMIKWKRYFEQRELIRY